MRAGRRGRLRGGLRGHAEQRLARHVQRDPQDTSQDSNFIGAVPAGPQSGWDPSDIVNGFLNATVSYPAYSAIAQEYLARSVPSSWAPAWSVTVVDQVNVNPDAAISADGKRAVVDVSGAVQASFNGTGQYVGAQQGSHGTQTAEEKFTLVKQGKQWRITNPPANRILTEPDFAQVYKPQDLYFFDSTGQVLVPDAVFVPTGTSSTSLATNLVTALLANPQPVWLQNQGSPTPPAITAFPPHSSAKDINVTVDGTTATVNLTGAAASGGSLVRHQMATQLVWTLTGQPGNPPNIQAVQLEFNGKPWTPGTPLSGNQRAEPDPEAGHVRVQQPVSALRVLDVLLRRQRAGLVPVRLGGPGDHRLRGPDLPGLQPDRGGHAQPRLHVHHAGRVGGRSPAQPHTAAPLAMVAVSPDGKYLAGVGPGGNTVTVWASGATKPYSTLPLSGVTAISWDRRDYLWAAHGNTTTMVLQTSSNSNHAAIPNYFPDGSKILGLSIAPDGVRVATIVQSASGPASSSRRSTAASPGRASRPIRSSARPSGRPCNSGRTSPIRSR